MLPKLKGLAVIAAGVGNPPAPGLPGRHGRVQDGVLYRMLQPNLALDWPTRIRRGSAYPVGFFSTGSGNPSLPICLEVEISANPMPGSDNPMRLPLPGCLEVTILAEIVTSELKPLPGSCNPSLTPPLEVAILA